MEENEWEAIQLPNSGSTTTNQSDEDDGDIVIVARSTNSNKPSIFPPSNHEGLPVTPPLSPPPSQDHHFNVSISATTSPPAQDHHFREPISATSSPPPSYTLSPASSVVDESELPYQPESESTGLKARLGILSSGVLRIVYGIRSRIGIWSIVSLAAIVAVAAYGIRRRRLRMRVQKENRDQMMFLIDQKDKKIKQLLIQIDQMNEILSARKRVQVHRIVIDRPIMNKQKLNWKPT